MPSLTPSVASRSTGADRFDPTDSRAAYARLRPSLTATLNSGDLRKSAIIASTTDDPLDTFAIRALPMGDQRCRVSAGAVDVSFLKALPDLLAIAARIAPWVRIVAAPTVEVYDPRLVAADASPDDGWKPAKSAMRRLSSRVPGISIPVLVPTLFLSSGLTGAEAHTELFRQLWRVIELLLSEDCVAAISDNLDINAHAAALEMKVSESDRRASAFVLFAESDRQGVGSMDDGYAASVFYDALVGNLHHLHA